MKRRTNRSDTVLLNIPLELVSVLDMFAANNSSKKNNNKLIFA
jgi:hypothetical protein